LLYFSLQANYLGFEFEHLADSLKIHSGIRQFSNALQSANICIAVSAISTTCAGWLKQAAALINAQRLWVNSGDLGCYRDDIDGMSFAFH
jgi:hypothetical protein